MRICRKNKCLNRHVKDFMEHVDDIKEESITDYLMWKWAKMDPNCRYFSTKTHSRVHESKVTGSDFELEVWLVTANGGLPLSVQAKKFIPLTDGYYAKLRYPNNTKSQMNKLIRHARSQKMNPCYAFYTIPDSNSVTKNREPNVVDYGVFIANAFSVEAMLKPVKTKSKTAKRPTRAPIITRNDLLAESYPLHALFCCQSATKPISPLLDDFNNFTDDLPKYILPLLEHQEITQELIDSYVNEVEYRSKYVAVVDMREKFT